MWGPLTNPKLWQRHQSFLLSLLNSLELCFIGFTLGVNLLFRMIGVFDFLLSTLVQWSILALGLRV
jgi:hypothetical protein